jgi:hypothetical protein
MEQDDVSKGNQRTLLREPNLPANEPAHILESLNQCYDSDPEDDQGASATTEYPSPSSLSLCLKAETPLNKAPPRMNFMQFLFSIARSSRGDEK